MAACAAGCTDRLPPLEGTTSLRVDLIAPADPGTADRRLPDDARDVVVRVTALDAAGEVDTGFAADLRVFVHHLGSLTPELNSGEALATVAIAGGRTGDVALSLPRVFGPAFLWVEDAVGPNATFATGTSPRMWFRDPWLVDISMPEDETALDALFVSPLERKQVTVTQSRYGAEGRLVVTGVYAQGYTLSDVRCADAAGTPPCVAGDYDHIFVFTFSRPETVDGGDIRAGDVVAEVGGGVSEFEGLTEIGFPRTRIASGEHDPARIPAPVPIDPAWLDTRIELERLEAGVVAVEGGVVCPLDDSFAEFGQWKLDVGKGCFDSISVSTLGQVPDFDPAAFVGRALPRVVGTLRPLNFASGGNIWLVYPRDLSDLTLP
ncbi:MAG: hypothetical protein D6689_01580 [Deltaproteobacteria bacterium]|nr:MAG: hypothetical protein D6689_01580 [Deltaproteobacteria bacterium]